MFTKIIFDTSSKIEKEKDENDLRRAHLIKQSVTVETL